MKFSERLITDLQDGAFVFEELDLSGEEISDKQAITLARALSANRNVKKVLLCDCSLSDKGAIAFASLALDELDLSTNNITSAAIGVLSSASFKSLILDANSLDDSGMQDFVGNDSLVNLSIAECNITGEGLRVLLEKLKEFNLKSLNIRANLITDIGWEELEDSHIETLNASHVEITDVGVQCIAQHGAFLKELNLSGNNITNEGAILLAKNMRLQKLVLNGNNIGDEAMDAFAENISITELWLNNTDVTSKGAITLSSNCTLKKLFLNYNKYIDQSALEVLEHIKTRGIEVECYCAKAATPKKRVYDSGSCITSAFDIYGGFDSSIDEYKETERSFKAHRTSVRGTNDSTAKSPPPPKSNNRLIKV